MQPGGLNPLLQSQVAAALGNSTLPPELQSFLRQVDATYRAFAAERRQLQAAVANRTEQLIGSTSRAYSFLDSINMGFILCDVSPEIVLTNTAIRTILDRKSPASTQSQSDWSLAAINQLMQPELELQKLVRQSLDTRLPMECKEVNFGARVLRLFFAPVINDAADGPEHPVGVVILVEDITERTVAERSKDEFFSIASHELRTPLTAIRGNASMIKKYYADTMPIDTVEMINDIHVSSIRLIDIVNDFLDVSALEQGKIQMHPETFAPKEVVGGVVRELQRLCADKSIELLYDPSVSGMPAVTADKQRVKQVIYNLIGNAVKFTDHGSITLSAHADDHLVYIAVTDTGRGMSAENQRLLFRKFQQAGSSLLTRDGTKGTGLGLYISKLIIELSGGTIVLDYSAEDKGSSFVFSLPQATDVAAATE